jgi:CO/xanthine dehydrogenase FAD-binding subunit
MLQNVFVPTDMSDALTTIAGNAGTALLAGGTLVMPVVNNDVSPIRNLLSLKRLQLSGIEVDGVRARIGSATPLADIGRDARLYFLSPVIESIASPPIRNLATAGGNLFAPQPYGDFAVALLALDAHVDIAAIDGQRTISVADVLKQGVSPGEIVTAIAFEMPASGSWFYRKAMRRRLNSAAIVTVAAVITVDGETVLAARIALGGVGPRPQRALTAEAALLGQRLDEASVSAAATRILEDAEPFSDAYASAWYRTRVLPVHFRRAILGD